jgi:hypothetical protein
MFGALISSHFVHAKVTTYATFEGGAQLGYVMARVVQEAEDITQKPFHTFIDGGVEEAVSTGAILGALLTAKLKAGDQPYSAAEAVAFYQNEGPKMFPISNMMFWLSLPVARVAPFKAMLAGVLKDRTFEDTVVPLSIYSYNANTRAFYTFSSAAVKAKKQANVFLRDAVLASTSIAGIFGFAEVPFHDGSKYAFQDPGEQGVCDATRNVYARVAAATAADDQAVIFSFGTGFSVCDFSALRAPHVELVRIQPDISAILDNPTVRGAYQLATTFGQFRGMDPRTGLANVAGGLATPAMMEPVVQQILGSESYARMLELMLTSSANSGAAGSGDAAAAVESL